MLRIFAKVTDLQIFWYIAQVVQHRYACPPEMLAHRTKAVMKPKPEVSSSDSKPSNNKYAEWSRDNIFYHHFQSHPFPLILMLPAPRWTPEPWVWVVNVPCGRRMSFVSCDNMASFFKFIYNIKFLWSKDYWCYTLSWASQF